MSIIKDTKNLDIDIDTIAENDKAAYELISSNNSLGVFQIEGSRFLMDFAAEAKPQCITDLATVISLCRPGPLSMGATDDYIDRRAGKKSRTFEIKEYDYIFEETDGLLCIHEDTMVLLSSGIHLPIRQILAGDSLMSFDSKTSKIEEAECKDVKVSPRTFGLDIELDNGFKITLTPDHKVMTQEGMKEVQDLDKTKDLVCIDYEHRITPVVKDLHEDAGMVIPVAYLMGLTCANPGSLDSCEIRLSNEYEGSSLTTWIKSLFPNSKVKYIRKGRLHSLRINTQKSEHFLGDPLISTEVAQEVLYDNNTSYGRRVFADILSSPVDVRVAYLSGMLDSHSGSLFESDTKVLCHLTVFDEGLKFDVSLLLRSLGIGHRIDYSGIHLTDKNKVEKLCFGQLVLKDFYERERNSMSSDYTYWTNKDYFCEHANIQSISQRGYLEKFKLASPGIFDKRKFHKYSSVLKVGHDFGDVRFCKIRSIESAGPGIYYSISVHTHHNLVGNGVIISNCFQEQFMQLSGDMCGFDDIKRDVLRKATAS